MAIMEMSEYGFKYSGENKNAIENISFEIEDSEIVLIAGDSGSGKSTFLKSLNGLIPAIVEGEPEGERRLNGKNLEDTSMYEISRVVGSVFQNPRSQFFTLNSTSEIVFAMENYGFPRSEMIKRIEEIKAQLPIENLMGREILTLSSGERQLLAIACAMTLTPKILIFDEPSANLDYGNVMKLRDIFIKLKKLGKTILVADHRFFYLNGIVDRAFLIENRQMKIYRSEEDFKKSHYNTRSFNLFSMEIPFKKNDGDKTELVKLKNIKVGTILENISLSFYKDEITAVIGANGIGKTTLAKVLTGSIKPESGEVVTDEFPFYVMQDADYQLFGTSVANELEIGNGKIEEERKRKVLQELDILQYYDTHPFDLSGGEKQRLQIAIAALSESKVLIFDEPTSGLDISSMSRAINEIEKVSGGRSVIIISHDYEFIRKISNRIIYIEDGGIEEDFYLDCKTVDKLNEIFRKMEGKNEKQTEA